MAIYKYKRIVTTGPNGTILLPVGFDDDNRLTELGKVDGWWYCHVPDEAVIASQPAKIKWTAVEVTPELRAQLKAVSPLCRAIHDHMQKMIRDKYPLDEELFYARISGGVAMGIYEFEDGEQAEIQEYAEYVEDVRQWGRDQRARVGL